MNTNETERDGAYDAITDGPSDDTTEAAITALRAALAEPEQEPVAWLTGCPECGMDGGCGCPSGTDNTPQREPLTAESIEQAIGYRLPEYAMQALLKLLNTKPGHCEDCGKTLIQMAEPERKPLTDEVIADLWHQNGGYHHHFARAVERWLKGQA